MRNQFGVMKRDRKNDCVAIRVSEDLKLGLARVAEEQRTTASKLIRRHIEALIESHPGIGSDANATSA